MSCGEPHETPCSEVLEKVYLYLDGEADSHDREHIRIHLDECAPCLRKYGLEQAVKALVARSCAETAPVDLRDRVLLKIQQVRIEIDHVEFRAE
ncbi:MAG: rsrA [Frankiales bacterium]|jgi:mycothiol system anti-sigma-R factor|nr:rsrA [Frankiales bacterium]MCW2585927.1 rsrA [Frankiales bacterium]